MNVTITVNLDKKCAECRKGGATDSGLCLGCVSKSMDPKRTMKSDQGRIVQARMRAMIVKTKTALD